MKIFALMLTDCEYGGLYYVGLFFSSRKKALEYIDNVAKEDAQNRHPDDEKERMAEYEHIKKNRYTIAEEEVL